MGALACLYIQFSFMRTSLQENAIPPGKNHSDLASSKKDSAPALATPLAA